ncbi:sigma-54 dependent transcriptional regulator [Desulfobacula sp.]|uniref:sigma-54-dependent transcriptional regulator n=1 Tax=Desulfobacula sp. TaxID=2593537 RepID=UPI0025C16052|nr:sigma-54 dependent transcriptional regulator [Desulfobacula sp.]MBC2703174.1 sigma-54-dependent Fis family transcriptional regulator [Desulfobacula sp.]
MNKRILIVDDEKDMLTLIDRIISEDTHYKTVMENNPEKALELFREEDFDVVMTDLKMPGMSGISLMEKIREIRSDVSVIILTAYATIETAVEATQKGADDYLTKPFRRERLLVTLDKAMKWQGIIRENRTLRKALEKKNDLSIIGSTDAMIKVFDRIRQVAPTSGTVLITGPSGTGKELVARAIHQNSGRRSKKMVTINCSAIMENMIESELFGHVKGAFTGAVTDKKGLVEEANGGTLFLDEIGDLKPGLQTRILRLIQEGEYRAVGSVITKKADLRFIAATNKNLEQAIRDNTFREDLFYRLNVIRLEMPPLKDRAEDIPLLSYHFLNKHCALNGKQIKGIAPSAVQALAARKFPGNVRELENTIERGIIFCSGDTLTLPDLGLSGPTEGLLPEMNRGETMMNFKDAKEETIRFFHEHYIRTLLKENSGNISKAAEIAGIQRQYLHRLMKESHIEANEFRGTRTS